MTEEGHTEPLARRAYEELAETYAAWRPLASPCSRRAGPCPVPGSSVPLVAPQPRNTAKVAPAMRPEFVGP